MITFKVDNVEPSTDKCNEVKMSQYMNSSKIETYADPDQMVIEHCEIHPIIKMFNLAYDTHTSISLSPDHIWLLLLHQLTEHINQNHDKFRDKFVNFEGKKELIVYRDSFIKGQPNPWDNTFVEFCDQIKNNLVGDNYDNLIKSYSTTTPVETAVYNLNLMDTMKNYFSYSCMTCCGIPEITLEGTKEDWMQIIDNLEYFRKFELTWWVDIITPYLKEFVLAFDGNVMPAFWQDIYKKSGGSGGPYISGWFKDFFLYIRGYKNRKRATVLNKYIMEDCGSYSGINPDAFPLGESSVDFKWMYYGTTYEMQFVSGFIGVTQADDLCLRPNITWMVREK